MSTTMASRCSRLDSVLATQPSATASGGRASRAWQPRRCSGNRGGYKYRKQGRRRSCPVVYAGRCDQRRDASPIAGGVLPDPSQAARNKDGLLPHPAGTACSLERRKGMGRRAWDFHALGRRVLRGFADGEISSKTVTRSRRIFLEPPQLARGPCPRAMARISICCSTWDASRPPP